MIEKHINRTLANYYEKILNQNLKKGIIIGDNNNITQKLLKIVKQRKTLTIVEKQEVGYKLSRSTGEGLVSEGYSYNADE